MAVNSKQKGKSGELELAKKLREYGYDVRRSVQYNGKAEEGQPDLLGLPGIHVECKRTEALRLYDAVDQAKRDSAGTDRLPVVFHRKNNCEWVAIMPLDAFMQIYREYESSMALNEGKTVEKTILHFDGDYFKCPACENLLQEKQRYCDECGQKLLWKDDRNETKQIRRIEEGE